MSATHNPDLLITRFVMIYVIPYVIYVIRYTLYHKLHIMFVCSTDLLITRFPMIYVILYVIYVIRHMLYHILYILHCMFYWFTDYSVSLSHLLVVSDCDTIKHCVCAHTLTFSPNLFLFTWATPPHETLSFCLSLSLYKIRTKSVKYTHHMTLSLCACTKSVQHIRSGVLPVNIGR